MWLPSLLLLATSAPPLPEGGQDVFPPRALLETPVGGLERTGATTAVVAADGPTFAQALRVVVAREADETNATQLTILNAEPVKKGDTMLAEFYVRGARADGRRARAEFLFEKATDPWTKSATSAAPAAADPKQWRRVLAAFRSVGDYAPGEAMASIRLAFGPQTVEIGGLRVLNFGNRKTLDELLAFAVEANPLGAARVAVSRNRAFQTIRGLGGNFCQPRYGSTEPMDPVGLYVLDNLQVAHGRVGLPLNHWAPQRGVYRDEAQAKASFEALQILQKRGIPVMVSVWTGPAWMVGTPEEQMGRTLPPERYDDCIDAILEYLVVARDKYGVPIPYFSFNEPDYGVNFRFSPQEMIAFIAKAGPRFKASGLPTKFIVGDTANGGNFVEYARPILEAAAIREYLGPVAYHSWDALGATDEAYRGIAELAAKHGKEVWCLEGGHDAQLWQADNPWPSWENALRTAMAYERVFRLSGASRMDYWTYQNNYPVVSGDGKTPFPIFHVIRQMQDVFRPGWRVVATSTDAEVLQAVATIGPKPNEFAALLVNPSGEGKATLTGLPPSVAVTLETSIAGSLRKATSARTDAQGRLTVEVPVRSVVTVRS